MPLRRRVYNVLEPKGRGTRGSRAVAITLVTLILLSVISTAIETMGDLPRGVIAFLFIEELVIVAVFSIEYVLRIWTCVENPRYARPIAGRVRFACTPAMLIDLLAILPVVGLLLGLDWSGLRVLRVLRVLRLLKLARYTRAQGLISAVLRDRGPELSITVGVVLVLVMLSATLMYYVERDAQPEAFASIPSALWWAIVTLTTIGYGDVYPVTPLGRAIGAVIAMLGIGMVALPTGILGSGFTEEIRRRRRAAHAGAGAATERCPHCGRAHAPTRASDSADPGAGSARST